MSIKNRFLITLTISLLTYQGVIAEVLHWPQLFVEGELHIKNKATSRTTVWLQKFSTRLVRETAVTITAKSTLILPLEKIGVNEHYSLLNFNAHQQVEAEYKCHEKSYLANTHEGGVLTFKKSNLSVNNVLIQNLFTDDNRFEIEFQDSKFNKVMTIQFTLSASDKKLYPVPDNLKNWSYFSVSATNKYSVFSLSSAGSEPPVKITPQKTLVDIASYYFLVGPRQGSNVSSNDSFVVKITDEAIAARARDLIANPQQEKMLFARIQKNHQGFNRNWSRSEKNLWSWSTSEVTNFADLGSTACNGTPQEVEDRVDEWVDDPGQICFWNYRVKKELSSHEVALGQ